METMIKKETIIKLIAQDMCNMQLIAGLDKLGLNATPNFGTENLNHSSRTNGHTRRRNKQPILGYLHGISEPITQPSCFRGKRQAVFISERCYNALKMVVDGGEAGNG